MATSTRRQTSSYRNSSYSSSIGRSTSRSNSSYRRNYYRGSDDSRVYYMDGSVAYDVQPAPRRKSRPKQKPMPYRHTFGFSLAGFGSVVFIMAAAAVAVILCAIYINIYSSVNQLQREVSGYNARLVEMTLANDEEYDKIMGTVDLEEIKVTAMNDLGMVYPDEEQVVSYENSESDYVRQYADVPQ